MRVRAAHAQQLSPCLGEQAESPPLVIRSYDLDMGLSRDLFWDIIKDVQICMHKPETAWQIQAPLHEATAAALGLQELRQTHHPDYDTTSTIRAIRIYTDGSHQQPSTTLNQNDVQSAIHHMDKNMEILRHFSTTNKALKQAIDTTEMTHQQRQISNTYQYTQQQFIHKQTEHTQHTLNNNSKAIPHTPNSQQPKIPKRHPKHLLVVN